jgi:endonuclease YncB( thermonuclease family)
MKIRGFCAAVLFAFFCVSVFGETFKGKCVGVYDGDTIHVLRDGVDVKVRLLGIDCPEKKQDFGEVAKKATSELCFGSEVRVEWEDLDRYGRTLGTVFCNGTNVCGELVGRGLAWHFKKYSDDSRLSALEKRARKYRLGLWSQEGAVPPWDFRPVKK